MIQRREEKQAAGKPRSLHGSMSIDWLLNQKGWKEGNRVKSPVLSSIQAGMERGIVFPVNRG